MFYGATKRTFQRAQELRKTETAAEKRVWERLKGRQLKVKFRRQHPLNRFIADFYSHEIQLVVEIDGESHATADATHYDEMRTSLMNEFGIEVIRFDNAEVFKALDQVVEKIQKMVNLRLQTDLSSPKTSYPTKNSPPSTQTPPTSSYSAPQNQSDRHT
ncbi:MAG: endonuclease domain-containing protein [Bacteroidota bacterium]